MGGGQAGMRGYLVQTVVALLESIDDPDWLSVAVEPDHISERIDLLWEYPAKKRAVQIKSSENQISVPDVKRWAEELQAAHAHADEFKLMLIGPCSQGVIDLGGIGSVIIPRPKTLDLSGFLEEAAHRLDRFLESQGLSRGNARYREGLAGTLAMKMETLASRGRPLAKRELIDHLREWIAPISSTGPKGLTPVVFISSTSEDLKEYRARAKDAAIRAGFMPRVAEYFAASSEHPALEACLANIAGSQTERPADLLVVIVAHRYGWVPPGQPSGERKSITWLECEEAQKNGKEVMAFLVDNDYAWPYELREETRISHAIAEGKATPELFAEVQDNVDRLSQFKAWLDSHCLRSVFTTPEALHGAVVAALYRWRQRHVEFLPSAAELAEPAGDPTAYLESLRDQTSHIDIVGSGKATRLSIDDLYIPLETSAVAKVAGSKKEAATVDGWSVSHRAELHEALKHRVVLIVGDPGSGKTTFLRRVANLLCRSLLGIQPDAAKNELGIPDNRLPVLIRLPDLIEHIVESRARHEGPTSAESPSWLAHYLAVQSKANQTHLSGAYFEHRLERGSAIVLLDGLDEAPSQQHRVQIVKLFENAARAYFDSYFVLTSRPTAYRDDVAKPDCVEVQINELDEAAIRRFLRQWCQILFSSSSHEAETHCQELTQALCVNREIRRMARNPVMLTALAVVHWNEKRLPEQRVDLYESILMWLARARGRRPGRPSPERCVNLHQELALAMQDHPEGRQVQLGRYDAAQAIAWQWRELPEEDRYSAAESFLKEEELDTGIVVSRGNEVRFWHLSFQEYLAARALAGRNEEEQRSRLLLHPKLYQSDWRETVLLLGGVLHRQATERVDAMIASILDGLGNGEDLPDQARCFALLEAVIRDLSPVGYQPCDPRYTKLTAAVLGIFHGERSKAVDIRVAIEAAEALGQAGDPRFAHPNENWVEIPAGEFWMGAQKEDESKPNYDPSADEGELPAHKVYLDAFSINRYPVIVGEYQRFIEEGGYQDKRYWIAAGFGENVQPDRWEEQLQHPNRPVVGVNWYEAIAYAVWAGCRLPTEAEWERAARGTDGRKYPWGNSEPSGLLVTHTESFPGHPLPVGIYPQGATPDGLLDTVGNARTWCSDWYGEYPTYLASNPSGPATGDHRVLRGCGRMSGTTEYAASRRSCAHPQQRDYITGFRLVSGIARIPIPLASLRKTVADATQSHERQIAILGLVRDWATDAAALRTVTEVACEDHDIALRQFALHELGREWGRQDDVTRLLTERLSTDSVSDVRACIPDILATYCGDRAETAAALYKTAERDLVPRVRVTAMNALCRIAAAERDSLAEQVLVFLQNRASADEAWECRYEAISLLIEWWPGHASTRTVLCSVVSNDTDHRVRYEALRGLAQVGPPNADTLDILRASSKSENSLLREAARESLRSLRTFRVRKWEDWFDGEGNETDFIDLPRDSSAFPALTVRAMRLNGIRVFDQPVEIAFAQTKDGQGSWTLFLGDNAVGKSTVLNCIALASLGIYLANRPENRPASYLRDGNEYGTIEALFDVHLGADETAVEKGEIVVGLEIRKDEDTFRPMSADSFELRSGRKNAAERLAFLRSKLDFDFALVCGYGPMRGLTDDPTALIPQHAAKAFDRVASLFGQAGLIDPDVLAKILGGDLRNIRNAPERLQEASVPVLRELICDLLPNTGMPAECPPGFISIHRTPVHIQQLSQGYSSLLSVIGHFLRHALELANWQGDPGEVLGIVLLDEVDLHLHPSWQHRVIANLRNAFKRVQFIGTTHSPICAGGIADLDDSRAETIHFGYSVEGRVVVTNVQAMAGWRYDQILQSSAFGFTPTRNQRVFELIQKLRELYMKDNMQPAEVVAFEQGMEELRSLSISAAEDERQRKVETDLSRSLDRIKAMFEQHEGHHDSD